MSNPAESTTPEKPKRKPHPTYSWFFVWVSVLTRPSVKTFRSILQDRYAGTPRALVWLFGTRFLMAWLPTVVFALLLGALGIILVGALQAMGFAVVFTLTFLLQSIILQWLARRLGGRGSYGQFIYAMAAFSAPLVVVSSLLRFAPLSAALFLSLLFIFFYQIVLTSLALRAVNGFGWVRAYGAIALLAGVYGVIIYAIVRVLLAINTDFAMQMLLEPLNGLWTLPLL